MRPYDYLRGLAVDSHGDGSRKQWNFMQRPVFFIALTLLALASASYAQQERNSSAGFGREAPSSILSSSTPGSGDTRTQSASSTVAQTNSMEVLNDRTKLGNGDRVSYRVVEERKEPILLTVGDSGEMEVPFIGRVMAAGKTCKQLAYELKPLLEKEYFYHATVILGLETLSTRPRGKVYLMGALHGQGAMDIPPDENLTVSKAILKAGGLGDFANKRKVKLVRKNTDGTTRTIYVDLAQILDKGHAELDPVLQPDDMIIVPERLINF
jgi:polysaccharide export outer membrane protein